jgi:hypothetical protein
MSDVEHDRCEFFTNVLRGRVHRRDENQYEGDYSSGSTYSERRRTMFLYEDGTFLLEDESFSTISSGGLSLPSEQRETADGTWTVQNIEEKPALVLWKEDGTSLTWWHLSTTSDTDVIYLDGDPWSRARID